MTKQEALRLADALDAHQFDEPHAAAAELRRLHAERTAADGVINDLVEKVRGLQTQRDALLEALKNLDDFFETYRPDGHPVSDPHELARAAIKQAEGETK